VHIAYRPKLSQRACHFRYRKSLIKVIILKGHLLYCCGFHNS